MGSMKAFAQEVSDPVLVPGAATSGGQAPSWMQFVMPAGLLLFAYLFVIRPQAKRQKEHGVFLEKLQMGTEVVTTGGVIGKVAAMDGNVVSLDTGSGKIRVLKSSISGVFDGATVKTGSLTPLDSKR